MAEKFVAKKENNNEIENQLEDDDQSPHQLEDDVDQSPNQLEEDDDQSPNLLEDDDEQLPNKIQYTDDYMCYCHCTCDCVEFYEEAHPMPAYLPMMSCRCHDDDECEQFRCDCGNEDMNVNQHIVEHRASCSNQCHECEDGDGDNNERRSPIPESLPSNDNDEVDDSSDTEDVGESIEVQALLPVPPPMPIRIFDTRMSTISTTMTPMTLLRILGNEDDEECDRTLHEAARAGDVKKLKQLLDEESQIRFINHKIKPFMSTPLREAVTGGSAECVELLLSRGAEVDASDIKGQTALFLASSLSHHEIMEVLLKRGANPEGSGFNSCTPLILCVREGCVKGVKILLKYGGDPQPVSLLTTCAPGWPLQHSIVYRHYPCFLALLKGGAIPSLFNAIQKTVSDEDMDSGMLNRLSITRTVLRHARECPEFLYTFRQFGGKPDPISYLPANMKTENCLALEELLHSLENPMSLKAQCRLKIFRAVGLKKLGELAAEVFLPSALVDYLNFSDC